MKEGSHIADSNFDELNGVNGQLGPNTGQGGTTLSGTGQLPVDTYQAGGIGQNGGVQFGQNSTGGLSMTDYANMIQQSQANQAATGGQQGQLATSLLQQGQGLGPAAQLANQQYVQALQQGQASEMGSAAAARGISPGSANIAALQGQAAQAQGAAANASTERLQSQLGAQGAAGNVLAQQRQGDIGALGAGIGAQNQQNSQLLASNEWEQGLNQQTNSQNQSAAQSAQGLDQNTSVTNAANDSSLENKLIGATAGLAGAGIAGALGLPPAPAAHGALVHATRDYLLSPGELTVRPGQPTQMVPGKAKYAGDDPRNDTQPAKLQPGTVVVPRSAAETPDSAAAYVKAIEKTGHKHSVGKGDSYASIMAEVEKLNAKVQALRARAGNVGKEKA